MRWTLGATMLFLLGACGSGTTASNDAAAPPPAASAGGEDRQVFIDLAKRACSERLDLRPNFETAAARRGCECAIDQLYAGKSADEILALGRQPGQDEVEERAADQCLANGR